MKTKKLIQTHSRGGTLPVFIKTQFRAAEDSNFKFSLYGKGMLEHEESNAPCLLKCSFTIYIYQSYFCNLYRKSPA